eukprot:72882-Prymnesium_polylepis.1
MLGGGTIIMGYVWSLHLPKLNFHTIESAVACVSCSCRMIESAAYLVFAGGVRTTFVIEPSVECVTSSSSQTKPIAVSSTWLRVHVLSADNVAAGCQDDPCEHSSFKKLVTAPCAPNGVAMIDALFTMWAAETSVDK